MICDRILGNVKDNGISGRQTEYVEIEWDEAFKKVHKKETDLGREIGIRLDDSVLTHGMADGDILYMDESLAVIVKMKECQVAKIEIDSRHRFMIAKVCYEIGNRHAPLFYGIDELQYITPYNEPMFQMLSGLHGLFVEEAMMKLDFSRKVSNSIHGHQH